MAGLGFTSTLTALTFGRDDGLSRRSRGRQRNVLQAGVTASTAIVDANARAALFETDRNLALVDAHHARAALHGLQSAAARAAAAGSTAGAFTFVAPPPDPFTAELLKKDALIERWSLAFHDLSLARDRDSADTRDLLRRADHHTRDAEARAALLAVELSATQRDLAASRAGAELLAKELRQARRDLAARGSHDQRDTRRAAGPALSERAKAAARLARFQQENLQATQRLTIPSAADLLNALGPLPPQIPAASAPGHPPRLGANNTYLSDEHRTLLLQKHSDSDSDSPGEEPGSGHGSPAASHTSSAKRRDSCVAHSSDGNNPVSSRRRHDSPAADFEDSGSARGP